jgi:N-methylhydantoinase B
VRRDGRAVQPSPLPGKVGGFPLLPGDVVVMESSGGGGFGDPLERDPARIAADVAEGYVTPGAAERAYGVVLARGTIDAETTRARREALRRERVRVRLAAAPGLDGGAAGRSIRLDAATAHRLGAAEGAIVELVNPRGAPLRAWVTATDAARPEIAPHGLRMLALAEGAEVEIRAVHSGELGAGTWQ